MSEYVGSAMFSLFGLFWWITWPFAFLLVGLGSDVFRRSKESLLFFAPNFATKEPSNAEVVMPAIKPISELRNYNTVLREVTEDAPVFLTKNGHGRFAIVDIRAYERLRTELELMSALAEGEASARTGGWVSLETAMKKLGV